MFVRYRTVLTSVCHCHYHCIYCTSYTQNYQDKKFSHKLAFGWNGFRSLAGKLGHLSALATHHVSDARLSELAKHMQERSRSILVLAGAEDRLILPNNTRRLAALLGAECVVWTGAGHGVHYDKRLALTQALQRHMSLAVE
jgi:pimeloyl-ACP methyl ester carboxylesterase